MLTTRRMEHGAPLLTGFDLGALMGAREKLAAQDPTGISEFIRILSTSGKTRTVRRLSAIMRATDEQLRQAEDDPAVMAPLEEDAAQRPYAESFKDATDFFSEWGSSFEIAPASSAPTAKKNRKAPPAASLSAVS